MPRTILHEVAAFAPPRETALPLGRWAALVLVAIVGSLFFGASLALVLPEWKASAAALWLAVSAGLAWCVFIPALRWVSGLSWWCCVDASLITMACGEVVLVSGALVNILLWQFGSVAEATAINGLVVGLSNVVMAAVLGRLLQARGLAWPRTLAVWMFALNGSGAVFFFAFYRFLHGA